MSTQQPSSAAGQEMDLTDIFNLFGRAFGNFMRFCIRIVDFMIKFWWVIVLLIISGAALGYFTKGDPTYESTLLLKTNFKSQSYVYNAIEQFNENIKEKDNAFITSLGSDVENFGILGVSVKPIVEAMAVIQKVGENDRVLSTMTREFKLEDERELFATERFLSSYSYHTLELVLKGEDGKKDVQALVDYINNQPYAKELKKVAFKNHEESISYLERTLLQLDDVVEAYGKAKLEAGQTSDDNFYFNNQSDGNIRDIFSFKVSLALDTEEFKNDNVSYTDAAVIVSDIQAYEKTSLKDKKEILYPILFIAGFLLVAGLVNLYRTYSETA